MLVLGGMYKKRRKFYGFLRLRFSNMGRKYVFRKSVNFFFEEKKLTCFFANLSRLNRQIIKK